MHITAFAAIVALFNIFLGIIPCTAGISHEHCEHETRRQTADEQTYHTRNTEYQTHQNRDNNRQQRREYHFSLCSLGGYLHATRVIRLSLSGQYTFDSPELTAHLLYHVRSGASYGIHSQSAEQESHHGTDKHTGQYHRIHQIHIVCYHEITERSRRYRHIIRNLRHAHRVDCSADLYELLTDMMQSHTDFLDIRCQKRKTGQCCRTDSKPLARSGSGVTK